MFIKENVLNDELIDCRDDSSNDITAVQNFQLRYSLTVECLLEFRINIRVNRKLLFEHCRRILDHFLCQSCSQDLFVLSENHSKHSAIMTSSE